MKRFPQTILLLALDGLLMGITGVGAPVEVRASWNDTHTDRPVFRCAGEVEAARWAEDRSLISGIRAAKTAASPQQLHALMIFAKFHGQDPEITSAPSFAQDIFDPDVPGSFSHFYRTMSLGRLSVEGTALPKVYESFYPSSHYVAPDDGTRGEFGRFNREILQQVDADVDFAQYDSDGPDGIPNSGDDDGYVDLIFINLKRVPRRFFLAAAVGIATLGFEEDFVTGDSAVGGGTIKIRKKESGTTQEAWSFARVAGIIAHEFGHILGLPDLYNRSFEYGDPPEKDSAGIGCWGLMGRGSLGWSGDDGPVPFCAWSREQLGWADVVEITYDVSNLAIPDVATTGKIFKIPISEDEYFLLENRQSSLCTYDRHLPGDGLLIWHVRTWLNRERKLDLECADGRFDDVGYPDGVKASPDSGEDNLDFWAHDEAYCTRHNGNLGDATDPFDGVRFTAFTPYTNPSSTDDGGGLRTASTGLFIEPIRRSGTNMVVDIALPKWEGRITGQREWSGRINVSGDIVVDWGAVLTIEPGTVVMFAAEDSRGEGADPGRCELTVYGSLYIDGFIDDPVVFRLADDAPEGSSWYGICFEQGARIRADEKGYVLKDSEHGIFWAGYLGQPTVKIANYVIEDNVLGNKDGIPNPGERLDVQMFVGNWTSRTFEKLTMEVTADDSFLVGSSSDSPIVAKLTYGKVPFGTTSGLSSLF